MENNMFCSHCGFENKPGSKFCENCGNSMVSSTSRPNPSHIPPKNSMRKYISVGTAIIFICFFLPWVTVSCKSNGAEIAKASGYELATGNFRSLSNLYGNTNSFSQSDISNVPNEGKFPAIFLLLLIGFLGLFSLNGRKYSSIIAIVAGSLGLLGLLILTTNFSQIEQNGYFKIKYQIGFIGQCL
jgi:hypothetical protein